MHKLKYLLGMSMVNEEIIKSIKPYIWLKLTMAKKNAWKDASKRNNGRGKFKFPSKFTKFLNFVLFFTICEIIHHK
jgi:hypothetical protein